MNPLPSPDPENSGAVKSLVKSAAAYLEARIALARVEGKEIRSIAPRTLILVTLALLGLTGMYFGLMTCAVVLVAKTFFSGNLLPAALCVAGFHLLILVVAALSLRKQFKGKAFFSNTIAELKEDKKWLEKLKASKN